MGQVLLRAGKANISAQIRTRGEFKLKKVHAGRDEVKSIIRQMGPAYLAGDFKAGSQQLASRRAAEAEGWHSMSAQDSFPEVVSYLNKTLNEGLFPVNKIRFRGYEKMEKEKIWF